MILSHITIYGCPKCGAFVSKTSPSSGYRSTGIRYTDGHLRGLDTIDDKRLHDCKKCRHIFWIREAPKIGIHDFGPFTRTPNEKGNRELEEKVPNWGFVGPARLPDLYGLHGLLERGAYDGKEEEIYLRKNLHYQFNDRIVGEDVSLFLKPGDKDIWENNLKALIPLIRYTFNETLYLAEIYRNLGKFYRARWVLLRAVLPYMKNARKVIWGECKKKNPYIVPFGKGDLHEIYVDAYPGYVKV